MKITEENIKLFIEYVNKHNEIVCKYNQLKSDELNLLSEQYTDKQINNINKINGYRNFDKFSIIGVIVFLLLPMSVLLGMPFEHWNVLNLRVIFIFLSFGIFFTIYYIVGIFRLNKINKYIKK